MQADPFASPVVADIVERNQVLFSLEGGAAYTSKLKDDGWNELWMRQCYGNATLGRIGGLPVACSGAPPPGTCTKRGERTNKLATRTLQQACREHTLASSTPEGLGPWLPRCAALRCPCRSHPGGSRCREGAH